MPTLTKAYGIAMAVAVATAILPAAAHPGSHDGLTSVALAEHLASFWHVAPLLAVAATAVVVAIRRRPQGQWRKAPASSRKDRP